jgi:hypothetical protein
VLSKDSRETESASETDDNDATSPSPHTTAIPTTLSKARTNYRSQLARGLRSELVKLQSQRRTVLAEVRRGVADARERRDIIERDVQALEQAIEVFEE